ncbi:MAG: S-methyl-5-thioribose-1-phosphate isomerase [Syntrophomonadaceae bacterium]|nr:S-methyl-5-thioribose-1-phosphate isomerase [Syntrophomonadaceae bacterium]
MLKTIAYENQQLYILNQNRLPEEQVWERCDSVEAVAAAIRTLRLRGAPLIGVSAAYGMALAVRDYTGAAEGLAGHYAAAERLMAATRPTAVNLFYALARMRTVFETAAGEPPEVIFAALLTEARRLQQEDAECNFRLSEHGQALLPDHANVLTICNAGALATCGCGTALGVIRSAHQRGKIEMVYACETRPLLQGARLTVWELMQDGIPVTLITDSMAATVMNRQRIDAVIIGADRIAANGDTANKIGSYGLAILAHSFGIPFYVAAPASTIDENTATGQDIPIEERDPDELRRLGERVLAPPEARVFNPAFDVTPHELISAIITEDGVFWDFGRKVRS